MGKVAAAGIGIGPNDFVRERFEVGGERARPIEDGGETMAARVASGASLPITGARTGAALGVTPVGGDAAGRNHCLSRTVRAPVRLWPPRRDLRRVAELGQGSPGVLRFP